jgi:hypothetical protein
MRRQISGLRSADACAIDRIPDGVFLVRVAGIQFKKYYPKPYYVVNLTVLEPQRFAGRVISSRLYCHAKVLWKLNWFLRDFGYDSELIDRDEVDEARLMGLRGVVKVSQVICNGSSWLRSTASLPRTDGKSSRRPIWTMLRHHDHL